MTYTFDLVCPRCGKKSQVTGHTKTPPDMNCGDCLIKNAEVIEFTVVRVMITCLAAIVYLLLCVTANAQDSATYRNENGQVVGRSITNTAGTTFYNPLGQQTGRAVTNNVGTTFYNAKGQQTGSARRK